MSTKKLQSHDDVLEAIADAIDVPEHMDQRARDRYKSIGQWLDRKGSTLAQFAPVVSPQGSFYWGPSFDRLATPKNTTLMLSVPSTNPKQTPRWQNSNARSV